MASPFLQTYAPLANDIATRTGLDPAVVLGIIDTETGGGQHVLSNNIFGISPGGKVARYPDVQTASEAFITLMQQPRYAKVLQAPPEAQAQALVAAGYNTTDPKYATKVGGRAAAIGKELGYQDQTPAAPAAPAATEEDPRLAGIKSRADAAPATAPAATAPAATEGEDPRLADLKRRADSATTPIPSEAPVSTPAFADTIVVPSAVGTMEGQGVLGRVGQAVARGYNEERPDLVTPAGREAINQIPWIGRNVLNPWLDVAGGLLGASGHGIGQALLEAGGGGRLGRDFNMLAQVAPAAAMPGFSTRVPTAAESALRASTPQEIIQSRLQAYQDRRPGPNLLQGMPPVTPEVAAKIGERPPAPSSRIDLDVRPMERPGGGGGGGPPGGGGAPNLVQGRPSAAQQGLLDALSNMSDEARARVFEQHPAVRQIWDEQAAVAERQGGGGGGGGSGGGGAPGEGPSPGMGPRSAGAAASTASEAALTPEQAAEYGSVADKQWLYKSMRPGEVDNTEYIKGISPTMAQREQTAIRARETKAARNLSPEAAQAERELLDEHNTKRKNDYADIAGSDVTQGNAIRAAKENIDAGLEAAYRAGGEVESQPIADAIKAERDSPNGKLPPVRAVMKAVEDALQRPDGTGLETDPRQVHGVRRVITYLQSKHGIAENPSYGSPDVQAALIRVKEVIDKQMEPAAPGFGKAIGEYATARQAIEAAEALQKWEPKLLDDKGRMQFSKFHRFMNDVIQARDPRAALNPYQSFTEAQMNRLKSLHDDLMRVSSAEDLARAYGSDSTPNLFDAVKQAASGIPGTIAISVAGHILGGPAGVILGPAVKESIQSVFTRGAERRATKTMENLLRPDPAKFPTRPNPFNNPEP